MTLNWIGVAGSSRVTAIAYDAVTETIYARFPDGVEWEYDACPSIVWDEFSAPHQSKGSYIAQILNHRPNRRHVG